MAGAGGDAEHITALREDMAAVKADVGTVKSDMAIVRQAIEGNGRKGLKEQVASNRAWIRVLSLLVLGTIGASGFLAGKAGV